MAVKLPYPFPNVDDLEWSTWALWYNLSYLARQITSIQTGQLVPVGSVLLLRSGSTCPDGYTKVTSGIGGRYLRFTSGTAGGTGGSLAATITDAGHTHSTDIVAFTSAAASSTTNVLTGAGASVALGTHTHQINPPPTTSSSVTTGITATIAPTFLNFIICEKD